MNPYLSSLVAEQHRNDLMAEAEAYRRRHPAREPKPEHAPTTRTATAGSHASRWLPTRWWRHAHAGGLHSS